MNPSQCSVVVVHPSHARPYQIDSFDTIAPEEPVYIQLLQSVFGRVAVHTSAQDTLHQAQQWQEEQPDAPVLCLVDLDAADCANSNTHHSSHHSNKNDSDCHVHSPKYAVNSSSWSDSSSPSSSLLDHQDPRIATIRDIAIHFNTLAEHTVPIVAMCSVTDDFAFMLACMHAGAAEYLAKPLRMDNVKTLFLKAYRRQPDSKTHHDMGSPSTASTATTATTLTPMTPTTPYPADHSHHRIKDTVSKDALLSKVILDMYAPSLGRPGNFTPLPNNRVSFIRVKISNWDFCPFDFDPDELVHCTYFILQQALMSPELSSMAIPQAQLYGFIMDLAGSYRAGNPYHNFAHAVDVLQCLYYFLCQLSILPFAEPKSSPPSQHQVATANRPQDLLQPTDIFALLIAAIGHDAAHPGVNNMFMINTATPLALLYNDRSVLENFHSMTLFHILKKHGFDQCIGMDRYQDFRKTVVASILATDMAMHNDYVVKFKEQATRLHRVSDTRTLDATALEQERLLLCSALIKCADISNVTRPFRRAYKWAELLAEEFVGQGDLERELGMPVQAMNDREKLVLEDMQIGFIRFVAVSLFDVVGQVVHEMKFALDYLQENLQQWERIKQGEVGESERKEPVDYPMSDNTEEPIAYKLQTLTTRRSLDSASHATSRADADPMFNGPTQMPTMAMTNYSPYGSSPGWTPPVHDPVYCQCNIM